MELDAQVILGKPEDPGAVVRMATTMRRASRRMARLIEERGTWDRDRIAQVLRHVARPRRLHPPES